MTRTVNVLRGEGEGARNARRTHCKRGHPLAGDNLYVNKRTGRRTCLTCLKQKQAEWRARNAEHVREYARLWKAESRGRKRPSA